MKIHEWCIAVLKGKSNNIRFSELYNICKNHYHERSFETEEELLASLEAYKEYFIFEDFKYEYVTFEDDDQKDVPILELAKEVLRTHNNRYTLSVLCRKMNESGKSDAVLDEASLKNFLCSRDSFTIEDRSITFFKLSQKGEEYNIKPLALRKSVKSEEEKKKIVEHKLEKEKERLLRKAIIAEERERRLKIRQSKAEHREERRIENVKKLISYYHITDETMLEQLWTNKLIRIDEYTKAINWGLRTVGDVYEWVESRHLQERMDCYRRHTVQRMLKIASFHDPEFTRLIPRVKFSGIQKANRAIKLSELEKKKTTAPVDVKLGDTLRWNYTNEEGIVIGVESVDGKRMYKVRRYDGTETMFEDDPKLFVKVEKTQKE